MSLAAELIRIGLPLFIRSGNRTGVDIAGRRVRMQAYERYVAKPPKGTETRVLPLGGIAAVRVKRPGAKDGRFILYLHGGGYVTGSSGLYRHIAWRFAEAAGAELIAIDYRLAPEHPFPAAVDDAFAAWRGLLAEGADPRHCAIMGDSAGGGLALALALRSRDAGEALPAALVALSPWTDLAVTGHSARPGRSDPMLNASELTAFAAAYLAGADPQDAYASPLYGDPRGLPPTLIQVGSDELLLDDAARMAERLRAAGVEVALEIWPRMPHVWHAFAPMMPEAGRAIAKAGAFIAGHAGAPPG